MLVVAVPVKDLANAKQRLMRVLEPGERAALARAMLRDVLGALGAARVGSVWVVTGDAEVAAIGRAFGSEILAEAPNRGHTAAVALAQEEALRRGARAFLTVPGDVPCLTPAEVRQLAEPAAPPLVTLVPSRSGLGTNGVALWPPDAMPLTFGEPSFENHRETARCRGLPCRVLDLTGLGLDVDAPDDLQPLLAHGSGTASARLVAGWRIAERLAASSAAARD
ncbi:MAG: 2-phospho-L-lactate guanylyltransferase [Candidatus Rokubacteria bacterium]|nr:2-phospho-L-lactate guanylyltransferase [Candidatus Rokubacteria bacterium]